jgi:hypothetical protein
MQAHNSQKSCGRKHEDVRTQSTIFRDIVTSDTKKYLSGAFGCILARINVIEEDLADAFRLALLLSFKLALHILRGSRRFDLLDPVSASSSAR